MQFFQKIIYEIAISNMNDSPRLLFYDFLSSLTKLIFWVVFWPV